MIQAKATQTQLVAAGELVRRNNDGLRMFRAMESQMDVVLSDASELLVVGGNRSGKSTISAVKFAAVARDMPIYGPDGVPYEQRLPHQKNRRLIMWIVGLKWDHIGQTIYRLLFREGAYKIVRDLETGRWRAFDPKRDTGRTDVRPSFPLIPESEIINIAWENKAEKQFTHVELKHADIYAFASTGEVKQGDPVDYIWIDERIAIVSHYPEWQARLSDSKGRIVWSSMPAIDNSAMIGLSRRAEQQAEEVATGLRDKAVVQCVRLRFSDNPFIDDEEKAKRLEGWSDDDRKQRDEGLFLTDNLRIYPSFNPKIHSAYAPEGTVEDAISRILRERNGEPPANWTRYMILDPGTAKPAVLFGAVPPPELWDEGEPYFVPYREIYRPRTDASVLMRLAKEAAAGYPIQQFIIDIKAGQQIGMSYDNTVMGNYSRFLREYGFRSVETEYSFLPGEWKHEDRWQVVERALRFRKCGRPQLRIVNEGCPNLVRQLEQNIKATESGPEGVMVVLEKPAKGQHDDVRTCLEYWLSRNPTYVEPPFALDDGGPGMAAYNRIQRMFRKDVEETPVIHCGPGAV